MSWKTASPKRLDPVPPVDLTTLYREGLAHQQAGRLPEALAIYDQILSKKADIPEVLFQKARCLQDRPSEAEATFRKALKLKPKDPAIWQGLHSVLTGSARAKLEKQAAKARIVIGSKHDIAKAERLWRGGDIGGAEAEAVRLASAAPQGFWPVYLLGLIREGVAALPALEAAHSRDPAHIGARLALARAALGAGQIARTQGLLDVPDLPVTATLLRAQLLRETAQPDAAAKLLADGPETDAAWQEELAVSAAAASQGDVAGAAVERALASGAALIPTIRRVALAAEGAGDVHAAEALVDGAISEVPSAPLLIHRAQLRQSAGDVSLAEQDLEAALSLEPANGEAYRAYANGRRMSEDALLPARIADALAKSGVSASDRAGLHFAGAKCAFDLGRDGEVMDHLNRGNRLMAKAFPYSFDADVAAARALMGDWKTLEPLATDGPSDKVIFVTGLPRSGTTLVETILNAHPMADAGGEMAFLGQALAPTLDQLRREGQADQIGLRQAGERYLTLARRRTGSSGVIVDKAISTFSRMGHALRALPGAHIVLVTRDPRDVGLSLYRNRFPDGSHRYAYDLKAIGRYIRLHDAVTKFWRRELPTRVHTVRYEDLTADPEPEIRSLLRAVDLPWDPACLAPQDTPRRIQTLSFAQARAPIGRSAVAGWQRFADDLKPLFQSLEAPVSVV